VLVLLNTPSAVRSSYVCGLPRTTVDRRFKKIAQFLKVAKTDPKKWQNMYIKARFESPKQLHQNTFETFKYLKQNMF